MASALLLSVWVSDCRAAAAAVEVSREGGVYTVHASAPVMADARTAFETLTDYEHLHEFVPDIKVSHVLRRNGNHLVVEHAGAFHLLFFSLPVRMRLEVEHQPNRRVIARSVPGLVEGAPPTLKWFSASYLVTSLPAHGQGVRIDYDARFELGDGLAGFIGTLFGSALVENGLRRDFEAMLAEIEQRQAIAASVLR